MYIVDIGNKASFNYLIKQHTTKMTKSGINTPYLINEIIAQGIKKDYKGRSRLNSEAIDENYVCSRMFCSFCLKT